MPNHDRLFKELLRVFFLEFLSLFWPKLAKAVDGDAIEFLQQEIFTDVTAGERHQTDLLAAVRLAGFGRAVVHVEVQAEAQKEFPERMFSYFSRVHLQRREPVFPIAVLAYDSPRRAAPDEYAMEVLGERFLRFEYRTVQLNRMNWRDFAGSRNPVAIAFMAKMRMKANERKLVKLECLRSLLALGLDPARQQLVAGFVNTYLRLKPEEEEWIVAQLKAADDPYEGLFWTYWHEKGHEQGLVEGRVEGRVAGLAEGGAAAIERILRKRLGDLPDDVRARIRSLAPAKLDELIESVRDFTDAAGLDAWLRRNSG